ncbi:MAG: hypothetical protein AAF250_01655 [Pseudomonadota bacterium]
MFIPTRYHERIAQTLATATFFLAGYAVGNIASKLADLMVV